MRDPFNLAILPGRPHGPRVAPDALFIVEPLSQVALCGKTLVHVILCSGHKGRVAPGPFPFFLPININPHDGWTEKSGGRGPRTNDEEVWHVRDRMLCQIYWLCV